MARDKRKGGKSKERGENGCDEHDLDEIIRRKLLEQLGAYGDSLLGEDGKNPAKERLAPSTVPERGGSELKQEPEERRMGDEPVSGENKKKKKRKVWEEAMELKSYNPQGNEGTKEGTKRKVEPEVVVYTERAKKITSTRVSQALDPGTARLKDLSHEVYQFGISGFDYEDKEKMEIQRAIKLGAKPPKNAHVPYKELMESQKEKREAELKQREIDRKMGLKTKKRSGSSDTKKSVLLRKMGFWQDPSKDKKFRVDGQVGRYKQGIQVLSKQDIHRIKKKGTTRSKVKKGKSR